MTERLTIADYPLAETRPDIVRTARGRPLAALTADDVAANEVTLADLHITPEALHRQAALARAAGRPTLARNFERAAEMVGIPQAVLMEVYELLRPGRARDKTDLLDAARHLREDHGALAVAAYVEEAAATYEKRGLFKFRF